MTGTQNGNSRTQDISDPTAAGKLEHRQCSAAVVRVHTGNWLQLLIILLLLHTTQIWETNKQKQVWAEPRTKLLALSTLIPPTPLNLENNCVHTIVSPIFVVWQWWSEQHGPGSDLLHLEAISQRELSFSCDQGVTNHDNAMLSDYYNRLGWGCCIISHISGE